MTLPLLILPRDDKVFQIEYAKKSVNMPGMVRCICCIDGLIFDVEKLFHSNLLVSISNIHIQMITKHNIRMTIDGLFLLDVK